jgi:NACalpha-BTF3-like transcription factor
MLTAQQFAEKNAVTLDLATRILKALYAKTLDAKSLDRVVWRLEDMLKQKELPKLMEALTDDQIGETIDEMMVQDQSNSMDCEVARCNESNVRFWGFSEVAEFAEHKEYNAGDTVEIQIMRAGNWKHPMYGEIKVDPTVLKDVKKNFDSNERGIELAVDENHEGNHKALAWYRKLTLKGKDALFATVELTKKGAELLTEGAYKYFSPEIVFKKMDEETGKLQTNLLIGGAFTNRPFFKAMQPLLASEDGNGGEAANGDQNGNAQKFSSSYILPFNYSISMNKFLQLVAQFCELTTISADQKAQLEAAFNEIPENERSTEMQAAFTDIAARFSDEAGRAGDDNADASDKSTADADEGDASDKGEAKADDAAATTDGEAATVSANEDGDGEETISVKASEFKAMQSSLAKMVRDTRRNALTKSVETMKFSEGNKVGVVLPKHATEVVDFALSLSEVQAEKFLKIVGNLQATASKFSETGSTGAEAAEFSEEQVAFFTEKLGLSKDEAIAALKAAQTK